MSKTPRRTLIVWLLTAALLMGLGWFLYASAPRYLALVKFSTWPALAMVGLTLLGLGVNGFINVALLRALGTHLSAGDGFLLAATASLANQLPVSGGIVARGLYLKSRHHLSYARFLSATIVLFACFVSANGIVGLGILAYWLLFLGRGAHWLLFMGFALMACAVLVVRIPLTNIRLPVKIRHLLEDAAQGWNAIGTNVRMLAAVIGLQMVFLAALAARYWLAFRMLSQDVSVGEAVLLSAASVLTQLASLAPGGLGVTEGIVGSVAALLGFQFSVSVAAVTLDRVISTAVIVVAGGISALLIGRQLLSQSTPGVRGN